MTTVAWDGKTLAADRQSTAGGTPYQTTKVFEAFGPDGRRWLYACSGISSECQEFTRRINAGQPMPEFKELAVLAVDDQGHVWQAVENLMWERKEIKRWAMGSGADYALGAMAAGATAFRAVQIASELDVNTGLGVDLIDLEKL